jgi:hypothetical protein
LPRREDAGAFHFALHILREGCRDFKETININAVVSNVIAVSKAGGTKAGRNSAVFFSTYALPSAFQDCD